ncbi:hypothetical protein K402DRAFT_420057 [Aulographum hederae CBS 113979]|uniref:Uncharacterized protein n=1 Tax=Aulographum hederae CBS 113979 TaxID=1176131 RepID=A0A6G1H3P9_9PEZI|nr:hypothetical protein K402DRAFT_420057 [Aulographum hederae CBS 113979]
MPPWGRPPGGSARSNRRRKDDLLWDDPRVNRFQELDSDEDDGRNGVLALNQKRNFVSDELFFADMQSGYRRRSPDEDSDGLAYGEDYGESEEEDDDDGQMQLMLPDQDELLAQQAMEKVQRARAKGKASVSLSRAELDALERRRKLQQEPPSPRAEARKNNGGSSSSRSNKKATYRIGLYGDSKAPAQIRSKGQKAPSASSRKPDAAYASGAAPPGLVVQGPNGPMYAPVGPSYPPQTRRTHSSPSRSTSRPSSRSASAHSRRHNTPPQAYDPIPAYPPQATQRYYSPNDPIYQPRQPSSSSRNSPQQYQYDDHDRDIDYYARTRARSSSSANHHHSHPNSPPYPLDPYQYQVPASPAPPGAPAAQLPVDPAYLQGGGRRIASGPPDVSYSNVVRRVPLPPRLPQNNSDPVLGVRRGSGLRDEVGRRSSGSSGSSGGEEVRVDLVEGSGGKGYDVRRSGVERRRRR